MATRGWERFDPAAPRPTSTRRPAVQHEKIIQADVVELLELYGAAVYVLGVRRQRGEYQGTMQTPGIADLEAWIPTGRVPHDNEPRVLLKVECKAPDGRFSPAQRDYRAYCLAGGVPYVSGGVDAVLAWLRARGLKPRPVLKALRRAARRRA